MGGKNYKNSNMIILLEKMINNFQIYFCYMKKVYAHCTIFSENKLKRRGSCGLSFFAIFQSLRGECDGW